MYKEFPPITTEFHKSHLDVEDLDAVADASTALRTTLKEACNHKPIVIDHQYIIGLLHLALTAEAELPDSAALPEITDESLALSNKMAIQVLQQYPINSPAHLLCQQYIIEWLSQHTSKITPDILSLTNQIPHWKYWYQVLKCARNIFAYSSIESVKQNQYEEFIVGMVHSCTQFDDSEDMQGDWWLYEQAKDSQQEQVLDARAVTIMLFHSLKKIKSSVAEKCKSVPMEARHKCIAPYLAAMKGGALLFDEEFTFLVSDYVAELLVSDEVQDNRLGLHILQSLPDSVVFDSVGKIALTCSLETNLKNPKSLDVQRDAWAALHTLVERCDVPADEFIDAWSANDITLHSPFGNGLRLLIDLQREHPGVARTLYEECGICVYRNHMTVEDLKILYDELAEQKPQILFLGTYHENMDSTSLKDKFLLEQLQEQCTETGYLVCYLQVGSKKQLIDLLNKLRDRHCLNGNDAHRFSLGIVHAHGSEDGDELCISRETKHSITVEDIRNGFSGSLAGTGVFADDYHQVLAACSGGKEGSIGQILSERMKWAVTGPDDATEEAHFFLSFQKPHPHRVRAKFKEANSRTYVNGLWIRNNELTEGARRVSDLTIANQAD